MATSINSYSVNFGLNASGFVDASKLSRSEATALIRTIGSLKTPAEGLERELDRLEQAYRANAIDANVYTEALTRLNSKMDSLQKTTAEVGGMQTKMDGFGKSLLALGAGAVTLNSVKSAMQGVADRVIALDTNIKKAASLGENTNALERFLYVADNVANVDESSAIKMLTKLTKNIGEATLAADGAADHFLQLGLSAQALAQMSPVEQFNAVSRALQGVDNQSQRVALAQKFLGKEATDLIPLLTASATEVDEVSKNFDKLYYSMSAIDQSNISATADAIGDLNKASSALQSKIAVELAPTIKAFADDLTRSATEARQSSIDIRGLGVAFKYALDRGREFLMLSPGLQAMAKTLAAVSQFARPFGDLQAAKAMGDDLDEKLKKSNERIAGGDSLISPVEKEKAIAEKKSTIDVFERMERESIERTRRYEANRWRAQEAEKEALLKKQEEQRNKVIGLPAAMEVGSQEAYKFLAGQKNDEQQKQIQLNETQVELQKQLVLLFTKVEEGVKAMGEVSPRRVR